MNYNHEKNIPRVGLFLLFNTQFIKIIGILQIRADLNINKKCSGLINFLPLSNNSSPLTRKESSSNNPKQLTEKTSFC